MSESDIRRTDDLLPEFVCVRFHPIGDKIYVHHNPHNPHNPRPHVLDPQKNMWRQKYIIPGHEWQWTSCETMEKVKMLESEYPSPKQGPCFITNDRIEELRND